MSSRIRTRVALVNDYELVLRGIETMLQPFRDRIHVVELDVDQNPHEAVDVALFDAYGNAGLGLDRVASLVRDSFVGAVALYTWAVTEAQLQAATGAGALGVIAKSTPAEALVFALDEIANGHRFVSHAFGRKVFQPWPGHDLGLTLRESEVAVFLAEGLTNREIAAAAWISEHTVKSHLKGIFRKLQVTSRGRAMSLLIANPAFERRATQHQTRSA